MRTHRILLALLFVAAMLAPAVSRADERIQNAAHRAVRDLVRRKTGRSVSFLTTNESFLSMSEVKVTGKGITNDRDDWKSERFEYSVKVRKDDLRTRDESINFVRGDNLHDDDNWSRPNGDHDLLQITSPRMMEDLRSNDVTLRGTAYRGGEVIVTIYDRSGREVETMRPIANRDRWEARTNLPSGGPYRAVVTHRGSRSRDEVRFTVRRDNDKPDWGWSDNLSIENPRDRQTLRESFIVQGSSDARDVEIKVMDNRTTVFSGRTRTANGRYLLSVRVRPGEYRLMVTNIGRPSNSKVISIRVR